MCDPTSITATTFRVRAASRAEICASKRKRSSASCHCAGSRESRGSTNLMATGVLSAWCVPSHTSDIPPRAT